MSQVRILSPRPLEGPPSQIESECCRSPNRLVWWLVRQSHDECQCDIQPRDVLVVEMADITPMSWPTMSARPTRNARLADGIFRSNQIRNSQGAMISLTPASCTICACRGETPR